MSIESLNEDLAKLEADVRHLSEDSRKLAKNVGERAKLIGEEAVAAQFIATEEAIDNAGGILETLASLRDIHREQLECFVEDQRESITALTKVRSPFALIELGIDHWQRRSRHVARGLNQAIDVLTSESRHMTSTASQMWQPFLRLLRNDWKQ